MREHAIECRRFAEENRQAAETARDKITREALVRTEVRWTILANEFEKAIELSGSFDPPTRSDHDP